MGTLLVPSHAYRLGDALYECQKQGHLCDTELRGTDGCSSTVHSLVIAGCGGSLKPLLHDVWQKNIPKIVIEAPVDDSQSLNVFVKFAYTGKIDISGSNVEKLLEMFKKLGISDAVTALQHYTTSKGKTTHQYRRDDRLTSDNLGKKLPTIIEHSKQTRRMTPMSGQQEEQAKDKQIKQEHPPNDEKIHPNLNSAQKGEHFDHIGSKSQDRVPEEGSTTNHNNQQEADLAADSDSEIMDTNVDSHQDEADLLEDSDSEVTGTNDSHQDLVLPPKGTEESNLGKNDLGVTTENNDTEQNRCKQYASAQRRGVERSTTLAGAHSYIPGVNDRSQLEGGNENTKASNVSTIMVKTGSCESTPLKEDAKVVSKAAGNEIPSDRCTCHICGKKMKSSAALMYHMRRLGDHASLRCSHCGEVFASSGSLHVHRSKEDPSYAGFSHKCPMCKAQFNRLSNLENHISDKHTPDKPSKNTCPVCGKHFSNANILRRHRKIHEKAKSYKCQECGKEFTQKYNFIRHQVVHTDERPCLCTTCGASFKHAEALAFHMKETHINWGKSRQCLCTVCGKIVISRKSLWKHMLIHKGVKRHRCTLCDKAFLRPSDLRSHTRTHTGEKPHLCDICGNRYAAAGDLRSHRRVHTGEYPTDTGPDCNIRKYRCKSCGGQFSGRYNLWAHTKEKHSSPSNEKFQCTVCEKTFGDLRAIKAHLQSHIG